MHEDIVLQQPAHPDRLILLVRSGTDAAETLIALGAAIARQQPTAVVAVLVAPSVEALPRIAAAAGEWHARTGLDAARTVLFGIGAGAGLAVASLAVDPPIARHGVILGGALPIRPGHMPAGVTVDLLQIGVDREAADLADRLRQQDVNAQVVQLDSAAPTAVAAWLAHRLQTASPTTPDTLDAATPLLQVEFGAADVRIVDTAASGTVRERHLPFGIATLTRRYLRHTPPTPLELEMAIEEIEPAIMALSLRLPANTVLALGGPEAARLNLPTAGQHRDEVEQLFQRLAAIALGRPAASEGLPADPHFFAAALLLRELMHHLGVERVVTSATTPSAPA